MKEGAHMAQKASRWGSDQTAIYWQLAQIPLGGSWCWTCRPHGQDHGRSRKGPQCKWDACHFQHVLSSPSCAYWKKCHMDEEKQYLKVLCVPLWNMEERKLWLIAWMHKFSWFTNWFEKKRYPLLVCNLCGMKLMPSDSYVKLMIMILYHVNYILTK